VPLIPLSGWSSTRVILPEAVRNRTFRDVVTADEIAPGPDLPAASVLGRLPVALLAG